MIYNLKPPDETPIEPLTTEGERLMKLSRYLGFAFWLVVIALFVMALLSAVMEWLKT